ncbi:restriction endonuclease subunit S [Marinicella sp. S1101]|uniref:restriction endonuclease subunit S n=1 Tax=Marinicella marina TaxID=2996016 RepID=UPI002260EAD9|nr:restriction endonuclease subunit S [Marinicella marina]MCX7553723.1 restriction endonuclease subunit S [Marinicella marina]
MALQQINTNKLKQLAEIQTGYSFRSRLEVSKDGGLAVIQMKDLMGNNTVNCDDLVKINMENIREHHFAKKGDLMFRTRGHVTTSAVLLEDPGKAVVSAPLLRIRVMKPEKILPRYLNWYISQRDAQIFLNSRSKGSVQKMVSKQAIEDLEVVLPSLGKQKKLVELAMLSAREQTLLLGLADKREQYISGVLMQYAKGE